ncbi:unnamed protein product [Victoria cruziana]
MHWPISSGVSFFISFIGILKLKVVFHQQEEGGRVQGDSVSTPPLSDHPSKSGEHTGHQEEVIIQLATGLEWCKQHSQGVNIS